MYLKELTVRGFKSFASATRFKFDPGITAIVGPNGSGKSNVVDALAWVMGEQGAKSLRGGAMADVIFAGGTDRPALGRAQVELTIDNSDGKLPIGYSEVTISRTMFRSGGSEYSINGQAVRLLDVQELLSDSGLGRQMHVIVGQGQLDAVLTATPEQRRAFIDEAAGVAKHRSRKERALRKLEAMDADLVRVLDLTEEIKARLRPLARQAKAAREASGVRERLNLVQARLLAYDLTQAKDREENERQRLASLRQGSERVTAKMGKLRQRAILADQDLEALQHKIDSMGDLHREYLSVGQSLQAVADLAVERIAAARQAPLPITDNAVKLAEERAQEAAEQAQELESTLEVSSAKVDRASGERARVQQELEAARSELRQRETDHERDRQKQVEAQRQIQTAKAHLANAEMRAEESKQKHTEAAAHLVESQEALAELAEPDGADVPAATEYEEASQRVRSIREELQHAQASLQDISVSYSSALATKQALQEAIAQPTSLTEHQPGNVLGALHEFLQVGKGWEEAITALLGPVADLVVLGAGQALGDVLAEIPRGMDAQSAATSGFLLSGDTGSGGLEAVADQVGGLVGTHGCVPALSVITTTKPIGRVLTHVLQGCYLAPSEEAALQLLDEQPEGTKAALATGEVITQHTVTLPGHPGKSQLQLRAALEEVTQESHQQQAAKVAAENALQIVQGRLAEATRAQENALVALREADAARAKQAQDRARAEESVRNAQRQLELAEEENVRAKTQVDEMRLSYEEASQAIPDEELGPAEEVFAQQRGAVETLNNQLQEAFAAENQAKMDHHVQQERHASAQQQARAFAANVEKLQADRQQQLAAERRNTHLVAELEKVRQEARRNAVVAQEKATEVEHLRHDLQAKRARMVTSGQETKAELETLRLNQAQSAETLLQSEVAHAQLAATVEQLGQEAQEFAQNNRWETADPVGQLISEYGPHHPWVDDDGQEQPFDRDVAQRAVSRASRELSRLGVVNPLAIEEYEATAARHEFLLEQVADLNQSKADLLDLIQEVDRQVEVSFQEAYSEVSERFKVVFERLFPGGVGRLELTEPDDPLTTGVEIYARPKGKRVTRLSLLSGGERSLAALAYLIAIFQARPSPFYVMDEVEAALDDINLSRVLALLEDLRTDSQLLIITHQKRTMEIADTLYGVSMRQGTTAVMSHRLVGSH